MPIVLNRRYTIYRDIFNFINRLKDITTRRSKDKLRTILPKCLKGSISKQYLTKFLSIEKDLLRTTSLSNQYKVLTTRFKESNSTTLNVLEKEKYTIANARTRRYPRDYTYNVFGHA